LVLLEQHRRRFGVLPAGGPVHVVDLQRAAGPLYPALVPAVLVAAYRRLDPTAGQHSAVFAGLLAAAGQMGLPGSLIAPSQRHLQ